MVNVTANILYTKFEEIVPEIAKRFPVKMLESICKNPILQDFLQWFISNVSKHNVQSEEEKQISNQLKKDDQWLTGQELDDEFEHVLKDYPELEELLYNNSANINSPLLTYELEKEEYAKDLEYLEFLQNQYKKLKNMENHLENQLEKDENLIEQSQIENEVTYKKCTELIDIFDQGCHDLSESFKNLIGSYTEINNKEHINTWVQLPLDIFIKQLETYSNYLDVYIKNNFGEKCKFFNENENHTYLNRSESENNEYMLNLPIYKENLINAKYNEIMSKTENDAWKISLQYLESIYNKGKLFSIPQSNSQFRLEIAELIRKRDFVEENVKILEEQLNEAAQNYGDAEINTFLVEVSQDKIEFLNEKLKNLENLKIMAMENGEAYSDLLCLLISSQNLIMADLFQLVNTAQNIFQSEYSYATKRCELMQRLQAEYNNVITSPTTEQNAFNKLFFNIMGSNNPENVYKTIQEYESLVNENERNQKVFLENKCFAIMEDIEAADKIVSKLYLQEWDNGFTRRFLTVDAELLSKLNETKLKAEQSKSEFATMHNIFKNMVRDINKSSLDREKIILWQTFMAAPNLLQCKYDDLKSKAENSHFKDNL